MPWGRRTTRSTSTSNTNSRSSSINTNPPDIDPTEILRKLILKARNLTDKDIWNHSLGTTTKNTKQIKHRATEEEEDDELLHETDLQTNYFHLKKQPSLISDFGKLRDYQIEGVSWMVNLRNNNINGILADEMGLGKTLQTISLFAHLKEYEDISGPHLVIVPKSTIYNWCREFKNWCPSFNVFALQAKTKEERKELIKERVKTRDFDVLLCSYEICMIEKSALKKIEYCYIVVDEAHRLKNDASKFATILKTFTSENRLLITGTPLQNNLRELWSLLNFLLPQLFDNAQDFENLFDFERSDEQHEKIFKQLRILLQPFLLRRLKIHVEYDLPPKSEYILFVGMSELQQTVYKKILMRELHTLTTGVKGSNKSLLNLVMQLRKATNHPYLFDGVEDLSLHPFGEHVIHNCGKLHLMDKLLERLKAQKSRCLIFSQMTRILDILEDYCHIRNYSYCRLDGSTDGEVRQQQMDSFNEENSDIFLFLLTTRAGGLGINLQSADIVIIYDSDWNPQMDLQAMDRAHRIGQKKAVKVYRLVTEGTVEERILERAELKLRLDAMVIQKNRKSAKSRDKKGSLMEMIQYGADQIFKSKNSTITDADIDSILAAGKLKTEELKNQWEKKVKKNFSELTLEFNYQEFDGQDYKKHAKRNKNNSNNWMMNSVNQSLIKTITDNMGHSVRLATSFSNRNSKKINYNVNQYYRDRIQGVNQRNANVNNINNLSIPDKLPSLKYWHLYSSDEILELNKKEWDFFLKWRSNKNYDLTIDECKNGPLTEKEIERKKELLNDGFPKLTYRDFGIFVRLCVKYHNMHENEEMIIDGISNDMTDVQESDMVVRYYKAFFCRAPAIDELQTHLQRINDAQKRRMNRLQREKEKEIRDQKRAEKKQKWEEIRLQFKMKRMEKERITRMRIEEQEIKYKQMLDERISKWKLLMMKTENKDGSASGIYRDIQIPDAKYYKYGYSKDIDRYLFVTTSVVGYGNWEQLKEKVMKHSYFSMDFWLQMQTAEQLKIRVDTILRACLASKKSNAKKRNGNGNKRNLGTIDSSNTGSSSFDVGFQEPANKKQKINKK